MNPQNKKIPTICCNYENCQKNLEAGAMYVTACLHAFCISHSANGIQPESCLICQQPLNEANSCVQFHTEDDRSSSSRITLIGEDIEAIKKTQKRALDFWLEQLQCDEKRWRLSSAAYEKECERLMKSIQKERSKCAEYVQQHMKEMNEVMKQAEEEEDALKSKQEEIKNLTEYIDILKEIPDDGEPEDSSSTPPEVSPSIVALKQSEPQCHPRHGKELQNEHGRLQQLDEAQQQRSSVSPPTSHDSSSTPSGASSCVDSLNYPQRRGFPSQRENEQGPPHRLQQPQQEGSGLPQQRSNVSSPTSNDGVSMSSGAFSFMDPFNQPLRRGFPSQRDNKQGRPQRLEQPQQMARALPQQRFQVFPLTTNADATTSSGAFSFVDSTNQPQCPPSQRENEHGRPHRLDHPQEMAQALPEQRSHVSSPTSNNDATTSLCAFSFMDSFNQPLRRGFPSQKENERERPHRLQQPQQKDASALPQQRSHVSSPTSNNGVSRSSSAFSFINSFNQPLRRGYPSQRKNERGRPHRLDQPQQMVRAIPQQRFHVFPLTTNDKTTTSSGAFPFMNSTNQPQHRPSQRENERERPQQEASALPKPRSHVSSPTSNDGVSRSSSTFSFMNPFNQPLRRGFPSQRENERGPPQRLEQPQQMTRALPQQESGAVFRYGSHLPKPATSNSVTDSFNVTLPRAPEFRQPSKFK